jgi:hypothetical protein
MRTRSRREAAQVEHVKPTLVAMAQRWNEAAEREERFAAESADWKELGPSGQNTPPKD